MYSPECFDAEGHGLRLGLLPGPRASATLLYGHSLYTKNLKIYKLFAKKSIK